MKLYLNAKNLIPYRDFTNLLLGFTFKRSRL